MFCLFFFFNKLLLLSSFFLKYFAAVIYISCKNFLLFDLGLKLSQEYRHHPFKEQRKYMLNW